MQSVESTATLQGRVISRHGKHFNVAAIQPNQAKQRYRCEVSGVQKKSGALPLVGDIVDIDAIDTTENTARICNIHPRRNELDRPRVANINTLLVMVAIEEPRFELSAIDRYLTLAAIANLEAHLCFTKADLQTDDNTLAVQAAITLYQNLNIPVHCIHTKDAEALKTMLAAFSPDSLVVLAGPSGVGKSSFINAIDPDKALKVGDVSEKLGRGTHTTRHESLMRVGALWIVDTPGFSHIELDRTTPQHIKAAFKELANLSCRFDDCLHTQHQEGERIIPDGCALPTEVDNGRISASRLESYHALLREAQAFEVRERSRSQKTESAPEKLRLKAGARDASRRKERQSSRHFVGTVEHDLLDE